MKFLVTNLYMKKIYWWHYELMEGPHLHLSLQNQLWVSYVILIHNHFGLTMYTMYTMYSDTPLHTSLFRGILFSSS